MMYKAYAGNGDDTTPEDVQEEMKKLAKWLDDEGFVLRTNGNKTGDVFELGSTKFEEYLPWNTFNKKKSKMIKGLVLFKLNEVNILSNKLLTINNKTYRVNANTICLLSKLINKGEQKNV